MTRWWPNPAAGSRESGRRTGAGHRGDGRRALGRRGRASSSKRMDLHGGMRGGARYARGGRRDRGRDGSATEGVIARDVIELLPVRARPRAGSRTRLLRCAEAALRAVAEVNLAASKRNAARLCDRLRGPARTAVCGGQGDGRTGHGAGPAARGRAARRRAPRWRSRRPTRRAADARAGVAADGPVLVLGAVSEEELPAALAGGSEIVAWDPAFVEAARGRGARRERGGAGPRPCQATIRDWGGWARATLEQALAVVEAVVHTAAGLDASRRDDPTWRPRTADPEFARGATRRHSSRSWRGGAGARTGEIAAHAANGAGTSRAGRP